MVQTFFPQFNRPWPRLQKGRKTLKTVLMTPKTNVKTNFTLTMITWTFDVSEIMSRMSLRRQMFYKNIDMLLQSSSLQTVEEEFHDDSGHNKVL